MRASYVSNDIILSEEDIKKFEKEYEINSDIHKTCGQIILGIMKKMKINVATAMDLTGLRRDVFSKLKNPENTIPIEMVVSFSMGFGLNVKATEYILESNGMIFNTNNRLHTAYIHLIEQHKGKDIETCNAILRDLLIEEKYFLGAHERGITYKTKRKQTI